MADVQPLRGLRYQRNIIEDLSQVVTPPFDVISQDDQQRYYERNQYNIIRLELGQQQPGDDTLNNVYTRAAATLSEWRLQGVLYQEKTPHYYLYQQRFTHQGQYYTRTSLLARVRLENWDAHVILPHEHIRAKDKEDRLELLRACATNLSPILCMYEDPRGRIRSLLQQYAERPELHITDEAGEEHLLHPISDPDQIALIKDFFQPRQLYIADGHHRYTTALQYHEELLVQRRELHPQDAANFMLMALVDIDDSGWLVLPTHRLLFDLTPDELELLTPTSLERYFTVQPLDPVNSAAEIQATLGQSAAPHPTLLLKTAQHTLLLHLNEQGREQMERSEHSVAWNTLDVSVVQRLLLSALLERTTEDIATGKSIRYSHDTEQALHALTSGEAQAVIFLKSIPLRQVCEVAQANDRMPPKSTYLYPKLTTGLVLNPLW